MATALKAARVAAGWSQPQVIERMRRVAALTGEQLPGANTMRLQLCRWENGRQRPCAFYRQIFCTVYQRSADELSFPPFADTQDVRAEVMTALLYAAPLTITQLATVPPARVRLYTQAVLADPRTPPPAQLQAGLAHARERRPAWLDRERLQVCERAAHRASTEPTTPHSAELVSDWLTTGRLVGSGIAAAVFTNHPG